MDKKNISQLVVVCLAIFTIGILLFGKYSPTNSKLVTICITGSDNQEIEEMLKTIKGIQTVFIDEKLNLYTFRYDSGKMDTNKVKSQLAGLGLKIVPLKSIKLLDNNSKKGNSKLFSVRISSASDNK
ncbi:MAG: hypothetical protein KAX28_05750 [Candidatus Marinimicrobia bacterium]|nr:hypothetical protein [Candidatus Neomarinimicrobiota bacterium]